MMLSNVSRDRGESGGGSDSSAPTRLRFGVFWPPIHKAGVNPTTLIEHDLYLVEQMDRLGYDEVWIGEHHSAGSEIICSPEIFLAAAAQRTKYVKLGAGVVSTAYHHPFMVAQRAVLLDHMTRGRFILGLGPGALPTDAAMIGLDMTQTRGLLEDATDIITRLLRSTEPVTFKNDRWTLNDAQLHLRPYSNPHMEIAIAAVVSPSGPRLAGRYGHSLLSIGATQEAGFDSLGMHWDVMEERSAHYGTTVDRSGWRLQAPMHIAETREQAYADVAHGIEAFFDYTSNVAAFAGGKASPMASFAKGSGGNVNQLIDIVNESGFGTIGTVEDAIKQIERLRKQSKGFGCFLQMAHDWAAPIPQLRSYELFAREVIPYFQGHYQASVDARERAHAVRTSMLANTDIGIEKARARYEEEKNASTQGQKVAE